MSYISQFVKLSASAPSNYQELEKMPLKARLSCVKAIKDWPYKGARGVEGLGGGEGGWG